MTPNLILVVRNVEPQRERQYPRTWLLYPRNREAIKIHVSHDEAGHPNVAERSVA